MAETSVATTRILSKEATLITVLRFPAPLAGLVDSLIHLQSRAHDRLKMMAGCGLPGTGNLPDHGAPGPVPPLPWPAFCCYEALPRTTAKAHPATKTSPKKGDRPDALPPHHAARAQPRRRTQILPGCAGAHGGPPHRQ